MPEHARRYAGALYDQQNENATPDWGGDDLFTRMPRPRAVDTAPPPRYRPALTLVDRPEGADAELAERSERRRSQTAVEAMHERAERLGVSLVDDAPPSDWNPAAWQSATHELDPATALDPAAGSDDDAEWHPTVRQWDGSFDAERAPNGRRTKVITGRPEGAPRPLSLVPAERRRRPRGPGEWVGARPERIMAWAFLLGLLLILIAISTADAATL